MTNSIGDQNPADHSEAKMEGDLVHEIENLGQIPEPLDADSSEPSDSAQDQVQEENSDKTNEEGTETKLPDTNLDNEQPGCAEDVSGTALLKPEKADIETSVSSSESVYEEADGAREEDPEVEENIVESYDAAGDVEGTSNESEDTSILQKDKPVEDIQDFQDSTEPSENLPTRNFLRLAIKTDLSGVRPPPMSASSLLQMKQADINSRFGSKDRAQQDAITTGIRSIKNTFNEIRSTIDHMPPELMGGPIDWEFWGRVVENYNEVVEKEQPELLEAVAKGIPKAFRGIVWQSVARSKSVVMEELYMHLKTENSIHEKAIKRDLTRTSFFTNVDAVDKAGELFNVIKAYSNFDPDVGYTQGMAFIAIPLIMNMTESECFCLLVTLMKEYEIRELFCPEMKGLHLLLHQFDRLLEQKLPLLFNHLIRQGVRSLMYASQWFLTFFSYKFPLDVVLRIFDVIITQGTEALIKLAINLMLRNETSLLRLNFDALLDFLKLNLFNIYVSNEFVQNEPQESKRFPLLSRRSSSKTVPYYRLDEFMEDSMLVEISPLDLTRYKVEFEQLCKKDDERAEEIEELKINSGGLRHEIKGYESELFALNHTHINVVQELVDKKVMLPEILSDIDDLKQSVAILENDISDLESKLDAETDNIPQDIDSKIQDLLEQNALETEKFANLDERFTSLTTENERLKAAIKSMPKSWFWNK